MPIRPINELLTNINTDLGDNNSGSISAADVRENMLDIVLSVNSIVASGDFNAGGTPFINNVTLKHQAGVGGGVLLAQSGIRFGVTPSTIQTVPYLGPSEISHSGLKDLSVGDPHPQYFLSNGSRPFTNNLGLGNNWLNSSGNSDQTSTGRGLQFSYNGPSSEKVIVGSGSQLFFAKDSSKIDTAKGSAKAWINFSASGGIINVRDSYNINTIERVYSGTGQSRAPNIGKFRLTFVSGVLANNNYVVFGQSNARSDNDNGEDFSNNTVGTVIRDGNDSTALRTLTFYVLNEAGAYVDAANNDLVIFGRNVGEGSGIQPIIIN